MAVFTHEIGATHTYIYMPVSYPQTVKSYQQHKEPVFTQQLVLHTHICVCLYRSPRRLRLTNNTKNQPRKREGTRNIQQLRIPTSNSPVSQLRRTPAIGLAPTTSCPICLRTRGSGLRVRVPTTNSLASEFLERAAIMEGLSLRIEPTTARQSVITCSPSGGGSGGGGGGGACARAVRK